MAYSFDAGNLLMALLHPSSSRQLSVREMPGTLLSRATRLQRKHGAKICAPQVVFLYPNSLLSGLQASPASKHSELRVLH